MQDSILLKLFVIFNLFSISEFRNKRGGILVATDVAARGLGEILHYFAIT